MTATVLRANANALPLADESVDLICTSPPYFALRSYQDGGEHYPGQLGSEPTPAEFVDALLAVTRECVRVLKPSGSLWVNLGDKYAGSGPGPGQSGFTKGGSVVKNAYGRDRQGLMPVTDVRTKSLLGIPWRYAIACIDDGLILRAEVIWAKPNGLPESVTDRVRRSHETWFHFVRQPRYYSAVDEIREGYAPGTAERYRSGYKANSRIAAGEMRGSARGLLDNDAFDTNPLGKLPGSVWTIPTQPLTVPAHLGVDHFAAFPMEWPRRIIRGWSPPGICTACGEGRRPVRASEKVTSRPGYSVRDQRMPGRHASGNQGREGRAGNFLVSISGYACACPDTTAPTRPAVVLDPFGGTGTVALVAHALGRHGITVDLSADYCRLARWRTTDAGEYARALQVDKPAAQVDGQGSLLDLIEEGA